MEKEIKDLKIRTNLLLISTILLFVLSTGSLFVISSQRSKIATLETENNKMKDTVKEVVNLQNEGFKMTVELHDKNVETMQKLVKKIKEMEVKNGTR